MPTITVTLTQEEYDAMTVMTVTPEEWSLNAIKNKSRKMRDTLVEQYSDKRAGKMSIAEKNVVLSGINLAAEKQRRRGRP